MRVGFRHADARFPFLWEKSGQPAARWHAAGAGPAQYIADTADGAWAEFLRHEEITDVGDLAGIARSMWAVELPADIDAAEDVEIPEATGGISSYAACQAFAATLRANGITKLRALSAALKPGGAGGQVTDAGLREAPRVDGHVWVLFGTYPSLRGWRVVERGAPTARILGLVQHLG